MRKAKKPWHIVKPSPLHGLGVFAARDIPANTSIFSYTGKRITPEEADERPPSDPDDPDHTFFFALSNGKIIDGSRGGNDAKWINHSCDPNCQAQENATGSRVYIVSLYDIKAGEELFYDYGLVLDEELTQEVKDRYRCYCQAENCRGTMLALPDENDES
ncbi:MAG TPA: SET domain-containing protein-lysine N-methyltransferase [Burkholderiaceae bacterium]|nr:SET domain-containing protein-lysine N-methyltransferase [Burkholderiaceae bacterium]